VVWGFVIGTALKIVLVVKLGTMRWVGRIARMTAKGNACRVLVEKPEGKMPLGTRRHRWENDKGVCSDCGWLRTGHVADRCADGVQAKTRGIFGLAEDLRGLLVSLVPIKIVHGT
jgi:hypothetical protein